MNSSLTSARFLNPDIVDAAIGYLGIGRPRRQGYGTILDVGDSIHVKASSI